MEGVSEQNVIGMAAGLAMDGFIPYINTIATFLTRRCFEQVVLDLCLHDLPVRLIASGGGVVYAPLGPTHEAIEDVAILRAIPNMTVVAPSDAEEMKRLIPQTVDWKGPVYIRLGKGGDTVVSKPENGFEIGKAITLREGADVAFLSTGVMSDRCLRAAEVLAEQGIQAGVHHFHTIKPLDTDAVLAAAKGAKRLVSVEEHVRNGGLGTAVLETLSDAGQTARLLRLGIPDAFAKNYGSQDHLLAEWGLDPAGIAAAVAQG
jgi:transketolase